MPKKSHKQPVNYDIVEVNEYPEEEESQEELLKPSRNRQTQKKQVKKSKQRYQSESEEDDSEEKEENESEEEQPQRRGEYKQVPTHTKLPKGKVEVPVKTKIMSEARLRALAKGREIAKQKRLEKKNKDLEELKQKLWSEFEGKAKQPVEDNSIKQKAYKNNQMSFNALEKNAIQESIDEVKKSIPKPRSSIYGEPIFVDFMNRKR